MIYTVTLNPSLDYIVKVNHFQAGEINRTEQEEIFAGGKGINVSSVLNTLGVENTALGFLAGFTGKEIQRLLEEAGIRTDFIEIPEGLSRINLKMRSDSETEINGRGPLIRNEDLESLYRKLDRLSRNDMLVLSGSIPSSLPGTMYMDFMKYLEGRGIDITVDAEKDLLVNVLPYHPFLIKPNNLELGEIFGTVIASKEDAVLYAEKLKEQGARNVLVSMAGEGAVFVSETGDVYKADAPKGTVINSVGAGDSMVAGFLAGYRRTGDYRKAFQLGLCAGSATAFSLGLADRKAIEALLEQSAGCF